MNALRGLPLVLLLATSGAAFCETHSAQDAPADVRQGADQPGGADCAHSNMQAARRAVDEAKRLFEAGDITAANKAIDASLEYAARAVDCSLQARKREKATEIELRRLIERMKELSRNLDTDEQPHLSRSLTGLEEQRDRLLHAIFGAAAGTGTPETKP